MGFIRLQTPPGERKSGIPDSVEIPAPVKATIRSADRRTWARSSRFADFPVISNSAHLCRSRPASGEGTLSLFFGPFQRRLIL